MVSLSLAQIAQYRSALAVIPEAMEALEMIEDCEGDLEDAAIALALQVGQEPDRSDQWIDGLAKRWRVAICSENVRTQLTLESLGQALHHLVEDTTLTVKLATPILIYVREVGVSEFCSPLDLRLGNGQ
ncbi:MAG: hypothetical protein VKK04_19770 [Synechococcales bacterium]|nr:hypothetical protein [Synechococcales bacterium]